MDCDNDLRREGVYDHYYQSDDILGYRPIKNTVKLSARRYYRDELLYDVRYTIGPDGLRQSMPFGDVNSPAGCVVFFGGSFTYGEGVNDHETMPFQVGQLTEFAYRIYNFGFHGYGPHQMLAALDHKVVSNIVSCEGSQIAIYQALVSHISRSAGLSKWDKQGPKYILGPDGDAVYAGRFLGGKLRRTITKELRKSYIVDRIMDRRLNPQDRDVVLFIGIVTTAKARFEEQFPGGRFHVILWDNNNRPQSDTILNALRRNGISVHTVSRILIQDGTDGSSFKIPHDNHPTALAHRLIAQYVVDHILAD